MSPTYRLTKDPGSTPQRRHLIEASSSRHQTVTCTCGWSGSTASYPGVESEWTNHVRENRGKTF
jgi:hypothetical protein